MNKIVILSLTLFLGINSIFAVPDTYPIKTKFKIINRYKKIQDPFTGKMKLNITLNLALYRETSIYATADGKVTKVEKSSNNKYLIVIEHDNGFKTEYLGLDIVNIENNINIQKNQLIGFVNYDLSNHYGVKFSYRLLLNDKYVNSEIPILFRTIDQPISNTSQDLIRELTIDENKLLYDKRTNKNIENKKLQLSKDYLVKSNWGKSAFKDIGYSLVFFSNDTYIISWSYQGYHAIMGTYRIVDKAVELNPHGKSDYLFWKEYNEQQYLQLTENYESLDSLIELRNTNTNTKFSNTDSYPDFTSIKHIEDVPVKIFYRSETILINNAVLYSNTDTTSDKYTFVSEVESLDTLPKGTSITPIAKTTEKVKFGDQLDHLYLCKVSINPYKYRIKKGNNFIFITGDLKAWIRGNNLSNEL